MQAECITEPFLADFDPAFHLDLYADRTKDFYRRLAESDQLLQGRHNRELKTKHDLKQIVKEAGQLFSL
jgi:hypothetical protein